MKEISLENGKKIQKAQMDYITSQKFIQDVWTHIYERLSNLVEKEEKLFINPLEKPFNVSKTITTYNHIRRKKEKKTISPYNLNHDPFKTFVNCHFENVILINHFFLKLFYRFAKKHNIIIKYYIL